MNKKHIYNKVRTYALATALAAVGAGMTTSCNKFLEMDPHNIITEDMFWNEKADIESILMGCYSKMQEYSVVSRMMVWGEFRSENLVAGSNCAADDQSLERLLKENITATNAYTYYGDFYTVINRCNTVLKYAPKVAAKDPSYTDAQMKTHLAEAVALRSLMYFYLIRTFRDVPYSEEAYEDDSQKLALPATPFEEILPKLIASLEEVVGDAPVSYAQTSSDAKLFNTGRITKGAIYAMLTDMCLWNKDYQKSIDYAQKVIDLKIDEFKTNDDIEMGIDTTYTGGYPLIPTRYTKSDIDIYGRDFNSIFINGNSVETIFELTYIKDSDKGKMANGAYSNIFGNSGDRAEFAVFSQYVGTDQVDKAFNVFSPDNEGYDVRGWATFCYKAQRPAYIAKNTTEKSISLRKVNPSESTAMTSFFNSSSWGARYGVYTNGSDKYAAWNRNNVIIYRVSDVMLMQAEAYAQLIQEKTEKITDGKDKENLDKAFKLVDAVNGRSIMEKSTTAHRLKSASYNTRTKIVDLVENERHRELLYEGKRYFDLVRRAMRDGEEGLANLRDHCSNKSGDLKTAIQSKMTRMEAIFLPYNLDEIKANPLLKQNPAFNSGENNNTSLN